MTLTTQVEKWVGNRVIAMAAAEKRSMAAQVAVLIEGAVGAIEEVPGMVARARVETDEEIEHRCAMEFGATFIAAVMAANAGWRRWSWEKRAAVLAAEKERQNEAEI
jgi:hypothetical protein